MSPGDGTVPPGSEDPAEAARWRRVKALFLEALDRPESERQAFVAQASAEDPALLQEVLSLLASERAAEGFCETPAVEVLGADPFAESAGAPHLRAGERLGVYEITGFVGAGGMGEVYRARHTLLRREVALKTLHAWLADPISRRRLIREARHAASLDHPGICSVHEIGEEGSTPFIVMEFVDGRSLREVVTGGVPPLAQALDWAVQIADALEHAHARGIVHRDLKSSNVMVDAAGRTKVLDFGLSKSVLEDGAAGRSDTTITMQGELAGTLSHMAPEVLLGQSADERSDVWSLGVLLQELTTGTLPFTGRTPFETSSAILNESPLAARDVPFALRLVIERCLTKQPAGRYQRAAQVRSALDAIRRRRALPVVGRLLISARRRTLLAGAGGLAVIVALILLGPGMLARAGIGVGGPVSTLALLPLENATGDPGAEFYAQGLTEALIEQLGSIADVRVISPVSAARAAATTTSDAEAARQLGADALITGRLRSASDRVALDLHVFDAARGRVLWSDTHERSANQVLALQADAVRALVDHIRVGIRPVARGRLAAARTVNPEAYEEYLKGRFEWSRRTPQSLGAAVAHFERALELDPTWAPAHAGLADCYNQFGTQLVGTGSPGQFRPRARAAAIRALQIEPNSAEAHATLGYVSHYDWQWDDAERAFRRAIELNPSYALARIWFANLLATSGRADEALEQVLAARDLDPFSLIINTNVGWVLGMAGRYEDARMQLTRTLELDSMYPQARMRLVDALAATGRLDEAWTEAQRLEAISGRSATVLNKFANLSVARGDSGTARELLAELLERSRTEYVPPGTVIDILVRLKDLDNALTWTGRAIDERSNYVVYVAVDTALGQLHRDPRYRDLAERAGLNRQRWNR